MSGQDKDSTNNKQTTRTNNAEQKNRSKNYQSLIKQPLTLNKPKEKETSKKQKNHHHHHHYHHHRHHYSKNGKHKHYKSSKVHSSEKEKKKNDSYRKSKTESSKKKVEPKLKPKLISKPNDSTVVKYQTTKVPEANAKLEEIKSLPKSVRTSKKIEPLNESESKTIEEATKPASLFKVKKQESEEYSSLEQYESVYCEVESPTIQPASEEREDPKTSKMMTMKTPKEILKKPMEFKSTKLAIVADVSKPSQNPKSEPKETIIEEDIKENDVSMQQESKKQKKQDEESIIKAMTESETEEIISAEELIDGLSEEKNSSQEDLNKKNEEIMKVESEQLESTRPTINQQMKQKKGIPLGTSERISKTEFESLNDEINELNSGINTLKHSYGSIIKSLMMMQNRRMKKKMMMAKKKQQLGEQKINFLTTLSTMDTKQVEETMMLRRTVSDSAEKYNIENFLNPITREDTFQMLFDEVEELNKRTEYLRTNFFDQRGNFLRDKYDQSDYHLDRKKFNKLKLWTKNLYTVVNEIVRNYNDDLLSLFRLV